MADEADQQTRFDQQIPNRMQQVAFYLFAKKLPKKGQATHLTECDKRFIIRKFVKNSHLSAVKVIAEFKEKFSA